VGYITIATEDVIHVNKAKPALFMGTFLLVSLGAFLTFGTPVEHTKELMEHYHHHVMELVFEIAGIYFFLFVAMTYIEALIERNVFEVLKDGILQKGFSYKGLFWITGVLAFVLSPIADNLTTALILATVLITIEKNNVKFLVPAGINIVVAANAGGAWSPFGDITTLMTWTAGKASFIEILGLFPSATIGFLVTAYLLSNFVPSGHPEKISASDTKAIIKPGGIGIVVLGLVSIMLAVVSHQVFHVPAMIGMLLGLSLLKLYSVHLKKRRNETEFSVFKSIAKIENDTLLFFFGILSAVSVLQFLGYLALMGEWYKTVNPTILNIGVGLLSAVIDNVPVMFAVLKTNPLMGVDQWLLVTLTAGIGGSLISFGSAAGIGMMGKLHGIYTFTSHMKLAWTVLVGYIVSCVVWYFQFEILGIY
jgi:Na+/H+ antiporter NhaD/arsenite permease-like protein